MAEYVRQVTVLRCPRSSSQARIHPYRIGSEHSWQCAQPSDVYLRMIRHPLTQGMCVRERFEERGDKHTTSRAEKTKSEKEQLKIKSSRYRNGTSFGLDHQKFCDDMDSDEEGEVSEPAISEVTDDSNLAVRDAQDAVHRFWELLGDLDDDDDDDNDNSTLYSRCAGDPNADPAVVLRPPPNTNICEKERQSDQEKIHSSPFGNSLQIDHSNAESLSIRTGFLDDFSSSPSSLHPRSCLVRATTDFDLAFTKDIEAFSIFHTSIPSNTVEDRNSTRISKADLDLQQPTSNSSDTMSTDLSSMICVPNEYRNTLEDYVAHQLESIPELDETLPISADSNFNTNIDEENFKFDLSTCYLSGDCAVFDDVDLEDDTESDVSKVAKSTMSDASSTASLDTTPGSSPSNSFSTAKPFGILPCAKKATVECDLAEAAIPAAVKQRPVKGRQKNTKDVNSNKPKEMRVHRPTKPNSRLCLHMPVGSSEYISHSGTDDSLSDGTTEQYEEHIRHMKGALAKGDWELVPVDCSDIESSTKLAQETNVSYIYLTIPSGSEHYIIQPPLLSQLAIDMRFLQIAEPGYELLPSQLKLLEHIIARDAAQPALIKQFETNELEGERGIEFFDGRGDRGDPRMEAQFFKELRAGEAARKWWEEEQTAHEIRIRLERHEERMRGFGLTPQADPFMD